MTPRAPHPRPGDWRVQGPSLTAHDARSNLLYDAASAALFSVLLFVVLTTYDAYGANVDELGHMRYGDRILDYYASGLGNYTPKLDTLYGGGYDLLGAIWRAIVPLRDYEAMHLLGALVGVLGILGVWKLGRLLFGPRGAFWAAVFLTLTPAYYSRMFVNPKDPPFAAGYIWSLYFLCLVIKRFPAVPWRVWLAFGVTAGLTMSVRVGGLLVICYLFTCAIAYALYSGVTRSGAESAYRQLVRASAGALAAVATAWAIMLALWPWAMQAPLQRPLIALRGMTHYAGFGRAILFDGEVQKPVDLPWYYLPKSFAIVLPELELLLLVGALALGVVFVARRARDPRHLRTNLTLLLLGGAILAPPAYALLRHANVYDATRHFLFIVPPISVAAAGALAVALDRIGSRKRALSWVVVGAAAILCASQARSMRYLHPYEHAYFNHLEGGLPEAHTDYVTTAYGPYKEAIEALARYLWQTEPDKYLHTGYILDGCFKRDMLRDAPPSFHRRRRGQRASFWIGSTLRNCHLRHRDRPVVITISRYHTPLALVRDLRGPAPPAE